ncbi:MAG: family 10 glycosylhydrolase [Candidatus Cohnella colombiensis]|uniref:Family 10 glycosylhydrolase n=1 Tax=Candidatus Cohnella colombiensis TaxID=3121368 RepID=A0AA95EZS9_9BACL|nr:MAG: family 10 glycosylhydrolase [Cohnella sp.]
MRQVRNVLLVLLAFIISVPIGSLSALATNNQEISIYFNGSKIKTDAPPFIDPKVNITMVPLRVISENLEAKINWDQANKTVTITKDNRKLQLTAGKSEAIVDNEPISLDASVQIINSRVMVPIRFVSEQLGLLVTWYQSAKTIKLETRDGNKQLRGTWISTVYNLDWPSKAGVDQAAKQQQDYINMLDQLQGMGINTVYVQVRASSDAFYASKLVPWSKYLTGKQGVAPTYDPLSFMIDETHMRGMEFHAWFNPFRANTEVKTDTLASNHVVIEHPDWIVKSGTLLYINPGIPEARQHIIDTIMEVVRNYQIDGVHLDDYFYPSNGDFDDNATYSQYQPQKKLNKGDWRRDNINQFVQQLGKSIHQVKPKVKYGISPFGVWRNIADDPTGSDTKAGIPSYDYMYADVRTWIRNDWIDYIMPQLYWSMTFSAARYDKLVDWWTNEVRGTGVSLYIGHASYRIDKEGKDGWNTAQEIIDQLQYNRQYPEIGGDVYFSARSLTSNLLGLSQLLRNYYGIKSSN